MNEDPADTEPAPPPYPRDFRADICPRCLREIGPVTWDEPCACPESEHLE